MYRVIRDQGMQCIRDEESKNAVHTDEGSKNANVYVMRDQRMKNIADRKSSLDCYGDQHEDDHLLGKARVN